MGKPIMKTNENVSKTKSVSHLSWKDATEITIPFGKITGCNKIERLLNGKVIDHTIIWANEFGDTKFRWHLPKKLFKDNKKYTLNIIPMPDVIRDDKPRILL